MDSFLTQDLAISTVTSSWSLVTMYGMLPRSKGFTFVPFQITKIDNDIHVFKNVGYFLSHLVEP
jgi:hypothetical protein